MRTFWKRIFSKRGTITLKSTESLGLFGATSTNAGVAVSEQTALTYSAVLACLRVLADSVASLPLHVYQRQKNGGKKRATKHPLYWLLHSEPNDEMTSFRWRSIGQGHLAGWGNSYNHIVRAKSGKILELWPLQPERMAVSRVNGVKIYRYDGEEIPSDQILHVAGFGFDGLRGRSLLKLAREAIGLGLATEEFGARFFGNGTHPGAVVEHPGRLGDAAHKNLSESLTKTYSGLGKSHKLLVLEEGMKLAPLGIPPEDSQFLETRKFQVNEICRIFRVPPHMIADLEHATFSNIEHQSIDFVVHTVRPWLVLWEQELSRVLLSRADRQAGYFIEHNVDGLLRGDIKSRYEAYSVARQNGWMSANDIRSLENMNPIEGGDIYLVPLNMVPATDISKRVTPKEIKSVPITKEERQRRSVTERNRIQKQYKGLYKDAAKRTIGREILAVRGAIKKYLRDAKGLDQWLNKFYGDLDEVIKRNFRQVVRTYAEAIQKAAAGEINAQPGMTPAIERFVNDYLGAYSRRHINSSLGQLRAIIRDSVDIEADIEQRLDEWGETRADKIAADEVVRGNNAISKAVFAAAGVQYIRWVAQGDKSCPYCQELDGKIVGINDYYVHDGQQFEPDGADGQMVITGPKAHPPLHQGCVCAIVAE